MDVREHGEIISAINAILNNKGIAEVKQEKNGLSVVEIRRTLKTSKPNKGK
uniref:Uncharacterized protein n=1 Tax=Siphoviridae sp. ctMgg26 TaxID=2825462 RepID=A0A8S5PZ10_9CAUD|nr:MAG TPA: hypothetical protein [Siphoviridae sp. ctMgg26]